MICSCCRSLSFGENEEKYIVLPTLIVAVMVAVVMEDFLELGSLQLEVQGAWGANPGLNIPTEEGEVMLSAQPVLVSREKLG